MDDDKKCEVMADLTYIAAYAADLRRAVERNDFAGLGLVGFAERMKYLAGKVVDDFRAVKKPAV